jgi:hypothetical protein
VSARTPCASLKAHAPSWVVRTRKANYSTFNGRHRTASDYSEVVCPVCRGRWRTKAAYVDRLPDET